MAPNSEWRRQTRVQVMPEKDTPVAVPEQLCFVVCGEILNQTPGFGYISYSGSLFAHYYHLHVPAQLLSL
jgi:hypothetical protein